jgi:hypothetical protein
MAQNLTLDEIKKIPPRKYKIIRNELQTGDLIFCSGNYFLVALFKNSQKALGVTLA